MYSKRQNSFPTCKCEGKGDIYSGSCIVDSELVWSGVWVHGQQNLTITVPVSCFCGWEFMHQYVFWIKLGVTVAVVLVFLK